MQKRVDELRRVRGEYLFRPGTTDDLLMDSLDSGDVVLFDRDARYMSPLGAIISTIRKRVSGCRFDHVGVVVVSSSLSKTQVPSIVELDDWGAVTASPYDERLLTAACHEIAIMRVERSRREDARRKRQANVCSMDTLQQVHASLSSSIRYDMIATFRDPGGSRSAAFAAALLRQLGVVDDDEAQSDNVRDIAWFLVERDDDGDSRRPLFERPLYARL